MSGTAYADRSAVMSLESAIYAEFLEITKKPGLFPPVEWKVKYADFYEYASWVCEYNKCKAFEEGISRLRRLTPLKFKVEQSKIKAWRTLKRLEWRYKVSKRLKVR